EGKFGVRQEGAAARCSVPTDASAAADRLHDKASRRRTLRLHIIDQVEIDVAAIAAYASGTAKTHADGHDWHFRYGERRERCSGGSATHAASASDALQRHAESIVTSGHDIADRRAARCATSASDVAAIGAFAAAAAHRQRHGNSGTGIITVRRAAFSPARTH